MPSQQVRNWNLTEFVRIEKCICPKTKLAVEVRKLKSPTDPVMGCGPFSAPPLSARCDTQYIWGRNSFSLPLISPTTATQVVCICFTFLRSVFLNASSDRLPRFSCFFWPLILSPLGLGMMQAMSFVPANTLSWAVNWCDTQYISGENSFVSLISPTCLSLDLSALISAYGIVSVWESCDKKLTLAIN